MEAGAGSDAVQRVPGSRTETRIRLGHVLGRRLAIAFRIPDLAEECPRLGGLPVGVEVDESRRCALIGPRDLVVNAINSARDRREVRLGQRVVLDHIAGIRTLGNKSCLACRGVYDVEALVDEVR